MRPGCPQRSTDAAGVALPVAQELDAAHLREVADPPHQPARQVCLSRSRARPRAVLLALAALLLVGDPAYDTCTDSTAATQATVELEYASVRPRLSRPLLGCSGDDAGRSARRALSARERVPPITTAMIASSSSQPGGGLRGNRATDRSGRYADHQSHGRKTGWCRRPCLRRRGRPQGRRPSRSVAAHLRSREEQPAGGYATTTTGAVSVKPC